MLRKFLHRHKDFPDLIRIVGEELSIDPVLVEKDYWIMHCLYGLQQIGLGFELKGGTSLSKGLGIIDRFSEDIDIRIEPPTGSKVAVNPNQQKPAHVKSRQDFYDWLAETIKIDGIVQVERDTEFDDTAYYRSGGIRLRYDSHIGSLSGIRDGVLLEVGFDTVNPNSPHTISSWAYDHLITQLHPLLVFFTSGRARPGHPGRQTQASRSLACVCRTPTHLLRVLPITGAPVPAALDRRIEAG